MYVSNGPRRTAGYAPFRLSEAMPGQSPSDPAQKTLPSKYHHFKGDGDRNFFTSNERQVIAREALANLRLPHSDSSIYTHTKDGKDNFAFSAGTPFQVFTRAWSCPWTSFSGSVMLSRD